ncbi:MAG: aminopeptidase [Flavobacteriales bacterium]|nr:MAG: aminopeptidase [Flavobacteriales bacterium]
MLLPKFFCCLFFFIGSICYAQNNKIHIDAYLDFSNREIHINQKTVFYNHSNATLDTLYFNNWPAAFKNRHTPLSKRLMEDYKKILYFAKAHKRGDTKIKAVSCNEKSLQYFNKKNHPDILGIILPGDLQPKDSVVITTNYLVKVPLDDFTGYGFKDDTYNLRYWLLTPAVYNEEWVFMSNLNMDDLYTDFTDYEINFTLPDGLHLTSDLNHITEVKPPLKTHHLSGENRLDIPLHISISKKFESFDTSPEIITNLDGIEMQNSLKTDILNRELAFLKEHLGPYPFKKLMVNETTYLKNPIYGLNQLPKLFNPFGGTFEWDIKMFKALTRTYLENTFHINLRTDAWIIDGIQTYLIIKYVEKFYPEKTAIGNISKIWGIRNFQIAKLKFNDKYPFVYQFAARKNYDQALTTQADSLSNFNRKIVNKYKAGMGLQYLDEFLNGQIVGSSIKEFYQKSIFNSTKSVDFQNIITKKTNKDLTWFFRDYINTKKKIDYTIKKLEKTDDSIKITIKNKRNITTPVALYGIKDKEIVFRKWLINIDSTKAITLPKDNFNRLSLNYEYLYPELNLRDNWKNIKGLFNRPIQFRFFKDVENPYYNQVFYNLFVSYNLYDGIIVGPSLYNEAIFKKKWLYKIIPTYGTNSKKITGAASFVYQHIPEATSVYRYKIGISGSNFHYDKDLSYYRLSPFASVEFKRKSLRDVGGSALIARYIMVNKERLPNTAVREQDKYNVLNLKYGYAEPNLINDLRYTVDFQLSNKFGKIATNIQFRKLTDSNHQLDFRLFLGSFIYNNTTSDFFSFSLDRPSDYMFDYEYLGRSETSGFSRQQVIIAEGGFKSMFDNPFANRWMATANASFSIWRWIELYTDAGFYKNYGTTARFRYDSGVRLNFIHNFLELYFPLQSSLGFEPTQESYASKIRFVITLDPEKLLGLIRRGFF